MNKHNDLLTVSPSQLLARLNALRSLQDAARQKLQRNFTRLKFQESTAVSGLSIDNFISHNTSSGGTSYHTFQSLLKNSNDDLNNSYKQDKDRSRPSLHRIHSCEQIHGVTELNLSQDSESVLVSNNLNDSGNTNRLGKYTDSEEVPIPTRKADFETLLLEKIQTEKQTHEVESKTSKIVRKPYLRRGEGLSRFGIKKDDLIIQNTKSLPWRKSSLRKTQSCLTEPDPKPDRAPCSLYKKNNQNIATEKRDQNQHTVLFSLPGKGFPKTVANSNVFVGKKSKECEPNLIDNSQEDSEGAFAKQQPKRGSSQDRESKEQSVIQKPPKVWASILTQEQESFLRQLKQSSYYKNFVSPSKSVISNDMSCDESLHRIRQAKETAEQNLFNLLENKVSNASFCSESSFIQRFCSNKPDFSGDGTPMMLQRCLARDPQLLHLFPPPMQNSATEYSGEDTCESNCADCEHESISSNISCSTCKTVEEADATLQTSTPQYKDNPKTLRKKADNKKNVIPTVIETNDVKAEMAEMNAKLVATSELLKERLSELENEIEMFRQENANLTKLREDFDSEKQRFYDEKCAYEKKCNEDKILAEYYLAEEKEKLSKQKQVYERYVREMRGRLNKKEKEEMLKLKKEIEQLKDEFRVKESRLTSCVARLRNQIKSLEKEKNEAQIECESLRKENRRIQQVSTTSRRLSNLKYLSDINKKLSQMETNDKLARAGDGDKSYNIDKVQTRKPISINQPLRSRAKSVPNLSVTSRYAKYFSQRDAASQNECEKSRDEIEVSAKSDGSSDIDYNALHDYENTSNGSTVSKSRDTDYRGDCLSVTYSDKFKEIDVNDKISFSNSQSRDSNSHSKSPVPPLILTRSNSSNNLTRSPASIRSNRSTISARISTNDQNVEINSSDPQSQHSITSENENRRSLTRTNLNPTEIKRPDGTRELRFPNGNVKTISADGKISKFIYYNGDIKETFYDEGKIKYYYAETNTYHTTHVDGLEVLQFPDGQVEKRYADGSVEIRLPNGSVRYTDPRNKHVSEEWRFPDGSVLTVSRDGEQVVRSPNGQVEVHAKDHKRREYPDGTVKLVYNDGTSETRYASGRVRIKDSTGCLIMDSADSQRQNS